MPKLDQFGLQIKDKDVESVNFNAFVADNDTIVLFAINQPLVKHLNVAICNIQFVFPLDKIIWHPVGLRDADGEEVVP